MRKAVKRAQALDKWGIFRLIGYVPSPGQEAFHRATQRFRLLCAGSRFGKSMAAGYEILPYLFTPGAHIWTAGPKYDQASKEFRYCVDALRKMKAEGVPVPIKRLTDNVQTGQMRVEIDLSPDSDGHPDYQSWLTAKSWHEPDTLLGEEVDLLVLAEGSLCPKGVYERYLRARIGSRMGDIVVPTTPHGIDDFLYPTFFEPAVKGHPDYWVGQFGTWDNPHHPPADIEHARATMSPAEFQEQYGGQFVAFSGRVYAMFNRHEHIVQPFEIPKTWPRYRCMDFGYEDPFACLWVAADGNGRLYVYREHYMRRWTLAQNVEAIKAASGDEEYEYTVMDPAAWANRLESGMSIANHMAEMGMPMIRGNHEVEAGIFRMMEWLTLDAASAKPGLVFFANCVNTIAELEKYSWAQPKQDGTSQHMKVQSKYDHACDALRYLIMSRPRRFVEHAAVNPRSFRALRERIRSYSKRHNVIGAGDPPAVISY